MEMKARTRQREAFWSCLSATIRSTPRWSCPSSQSVDSTPSSTAETTGRGSVRPRAGVGKTTGRGRSPVRMFVSSSSFETAAGSRPRRAWYALWRETNGLSSARRLRSVTSRPDCPGCGYGLPGTRPDCPGLNWTTRDTTGLPGTWPDARDSTGLPGTRLHSAILGFDRFSRDAVLGEVTLPLDDNHLLSALIDRRGVLETVELNIEPTPQTQSPITKVCVLHNID